MYRHHLLTHDPRVLRRPRDVRSPRRHGSSQLLLAIGFLCAQAIHLDAPHLRASSLHVGSPLFRGACRSRTASAALWWPRAHARGRGALGRAGLPALAAPLCAATDGSGGFYNYIFLTSPDAPGLAGLGRREPRTAHSVGGPPHGQRAHCLDRGDRPLPHRFARHVDGAL